MVKKRTLRKAAPLRRGSRVALVAPAFSFDTKLFEQGRKFLEDKYQVETLVAPDLFEKHAYFAGSDSRRLNELTRWLKDPSIDAILAARGGYGCTRIYSALLKNLKAVKRLRPKLVGGFSDLTILLNGLYQDLGWVTFHSPHVVSRLFREPAKIESETFYQHFFTSDPVGKIEWPEMKTLVVGTASAPLVGGCLSMVAASLATPYEIETDGKILFLEDVTEQSYRIDRMLTHLLHAGKFNKVRAVIFGQMTDIVAPKDRPELDAAAAIQLSVLPFLKQKKIPCIFGFPSGHGNPQVTFPIGTRVRLHAPAQGPAWVDFFESGTEGL